MSHFNRYQYQSDLQYSLGDIICVYHKWADARTKIGVQVKLPDIPTASDMLIL